MADVSECTLFVRNIPLDITTEKLGDIFSDIGPLKRCFIVRDKGDSKTSKGFGYVTYALKDDAETALKRIKTIGGKTISVKYANKRGTVEKNNTDDSAKVSPKKFLNKNARLIVRNLSFKANEDKVGKEFSKHGKIAEVVIPKKRDGKMIGCCFVQYFSMTAADTALKEMNSKNFLGRVIAVDWALPKDKFISATKPKKSEEDETEVKDEDDSESDFGKDEKESEKNEVGEEESENESDEDSENDDESNESADETDDDNDNETDSDDDDSEKEDNSDEEDDDDDDEEEDEESFKPLKSDVKEGRTLFVRNLTFDTTEDDLKTAFRAYGSVKYAVVCVDPDTEHPKGTAFVQFYNKDDANICLTKACDESEKGGIEIDGRKVVVSLALSREEVRRRAEEKHNKEPKDSRNLFLTREGLVRPGSLAAEGVSTSDLAKRAQLEVWKRQMLRNLNVFISKTRLCVRNLMPTCNNEQLKKIFLEAGGAGANITEARVIYNHKPINGEATSKGFGFVTFTTHDNALRALRRVNNNPKIFTNEQRPIVEFSLEKKTAVNAKRKRVERSREKFQRKNKESEKHSSSSGKEKTDKNTNLDADNDPEFVGAKSRMGVKAKLPSHMGPKIRHKRRPNQINMTKNNKKRRKGDSRKQRKRRKFEN